jgi:protein involved in polysaccharide export with SLBB domain
MIFNTLPSAFRASVRSTPHAEPVTSRRPLRYIVRVALLVLAIASWSVPDVEAQVVDVVPSGPQRATRAELTELVATLEARLAANARGVDRNRTMAELAAVKQRLVDGDFRVGNQFVVTIVSPAMNGSDTVSVRDSLLVTLPKIPDVSLKGVLRSELNEKLSTHVARYLREAQVRANVLTRITITGAVQKPGIYSPSPDRPIGELMMLAGGPVPDAKLDQLEISRSGRKVLSIKDSKKALREGRTLDQLDVRPGDEVLIPQKRRINWSQVLQAVGIAVTLIFAVISFLRLYYEQQE